METSINIQEKCKNSVPDATISQPSFKIVIETKLNSQFDIKQLLDHTSSFNDEKYKVLLTLDPNKFANSLETELQMELAKKGALIYHKHLTFDEFIKNVEDVIYERDFELQAILDDYKEYCSDSKLIRNDWKQMRVRVASVTMDFNIENGLYYDNASHGFSGHRYIGLYTEKAVRAVGELTAIVTAVMDGDSLIITDTREGAVNEDMKRKIRAAIEKAKSYGWDIGTIPHNYFFVAKFYRTEYRKASLHALLGTRFFDLCEVLGMDKLPETEEIARLLNDKQWL